MIAIETPHLFDGAAMHGERVVLMQHGLIVDVLAKAPHGVAVQALPAGTVLAPGFIDLQVNGGGGVLFNDSPNLEGLRRIAAVHAMQGTTALLPTLISAGADLRAAGLAAVQAALAAELPGIVGIHIEGPFIARARRGIHPEAAIIDLAPADTAALCAADAGARLITLAAEAAHPAQIGALAGAGWAVFLGHSDAACEAAMEALDAGAIGFTHLFNAMSQFGSRTPGMVGAAMASDTAVASIIVDGHHVHPAAVRAAWRALGPARLCLISDAMPTVGDADGDGFQFAGKSIRLDGSRLTDAAGTLAGAHLTMREAVRGAVHLAGLPLADALRMATSTPAACLGLRDRGAIRAGLRADLVALDQNCALAGVWLAGQPVRGRQTPSVSSA